MYIILTINSSSICVCVCVCVSLSSCIFFLFQKVNVSSDDQWPSTLADYIRHNDEALMKASERLLATYREELLPCSSFEEFCDVTGMRYFHF